MRSRLKTHVKQQNKKTIFGIIVLLAVVIIFGMKLIVGFSILIEKFKTPKDDINETQGINYIAPPILNPIPSATKTSAIEVSGYSLSSDTSIELYINGESAGKTRSKSDKSFEFSINLNSGENELKARAINASGKQSDYSQSIKISYLSKNPFLEINSPQDGQKYKKDESPIKIAGKSDKDVLVTVNDFRAISNDDGTFYYMYSLKDNDNNLKIVATDDAGNKTEKNLRINIE